MIWPWRKRDRKEKESREVELETAKKQAEELVQRTRKLLRENNLAADIRKALGAR